MLFTYIFQNNFLLPIILSKMTNKERHENEKKKQPWYYPWTRRGVNGVHFTILFIDLKSNEIPGAEIQKNVIILSISNTPGDHLGYRGVK